MRIVWILVLLGLPAGASDGDLISRAPESGLKVHAMVVHDQGILLPLERALMMVDGSSGVLPRNLSRLERIALAAAHRYHDHLQELRAAGYEVVVWREPSRLDFIQALEDPRTAGILHEGHAAVVYPWKSSDGKLRSRFLFVDADGNSEPLGRLELEALERTRGRGVRPSPNLRFITTSGCFAATGEEFYRRHLNLSERVAFIASAETQNDITIYKRFSGVRRQIIRSLAGAVTFAAVTCGLERSIAKRASRSVAPRSAHLHSR